MKIYEPNYTQVPNVILSLMPELKESELKVLLAIVRKTFGWQKTRDRISLTQLQEMTGLGRASVSEAIQSDKFKGIVKVYRDKKGNEFEMIVHSMNSEPPEEEVVQNSNQGSMNSEPIGSMNSEHTKETITKETIQKKSPSLSDQRIVDFLKGRSLEEIEDKITLLTCIIWTDVNDLRPNNKITLSAKLKDWRDPIRLMVERDDRTLKEIFALWRKVHRDSFWRGNILSTGKLRDKFDELAIKFMNDGGKNGVDIDRIIDEMQ